jgi:hypothetical protein
MYTFVLGRPFPFALKDAHGHKNAVARQIEIADEIAALLGF